MAQKALLALEDGTVFEGESFGAQGECSGEVVFNTSMSGYQEVITDPSYKGQIVAMTYPLIGNYGINSEDGESRGTWLEGFVVKELSRRVSNWRSEMCLHDYLLQNGVVGIQGIDTRELTMHIRDAGAMRSVISTEDLDPASLTKKAAESPGLEGRDLVKDVTIDELFEWEPGNANGGPLVVAIDCGIKYGILRCLRETGCRVLVVPASTTAEEILDLKPDGVFISNGPGDPEPVRYVIETIRQLLKEPALPMFGICLGQQLLGQALGGKTYKLKFGHHGANHPVMDMATRKVAITVQNHGFCVDIESLDKSKIEITHMNLNDQTLEGIRHRELPVFSVQFHPEASPGPHDARYLFDEFLQMMKQS